jgi:hypothetical protein
MTQKADALKAQAGNVADSESRTLLKPLAMPAMLPGLGATLGATRMNNLRTPRTRMDNRERRAAGHELIRTDLNAATGIYGSGGCGFRSLA